MIIQNGKCISGIATMERTENNVKHAWLASNPRRTPRRKRSWRSGEPRLDGLIVEEAEPPNGNQYWHIIKQCQQSPDDAHVEVGSHRYGREGNEQNGDYGNRAKANRYPCPNENRNASPSFRANKPSSGENTKNRHSQHEYECEQRHRDEQTGDILLWRTDKNPTQAEQVAKDGEKTAEYG
jgi:hypothetical protein